MKRPSLIYAGAVCAILTFVALVVGAYIAYQKYLQYQPQITQLQNTAGSSGQILGSVYSILSKGTKANG